jgi:lipopolysaccharide export system protein LptC
LSDRLATWAPVALLLLLAALTWWLDSKVQPLTQRPDGSTRHDPDMYVEGYAASRMTPEGVKQYELTGKRLVHYPDDNSTELESPQLKYFDPDRAPVTVKADTAQVTDGGDNVYFSGNVQVVRAPYADKPELGVLTTYLHVMPEQQLARTDKPVTLMEGNSTATSLGLEFDNKARQLKLNSQVRARYETPRSLKLAQPRR